MSKRVVAFASGCATVLAVVAGCMNPFSGQGHIVSCRSYGIAHVNPAASPMRPEIAFVRRERPDGADELCLMDLDGANVRSLVRFSSSIGPLLWSPTGDWILFTAWTAGQCDLYRIHRDDRVLENLTRNPEFDGNPQWSPEGERIAFFRATPKLSKQGLLDTYRNKRVMVMSADGSDPQVIARDSYPIAWSPDGRWLVLQRGDEVRLLQADGKTERALAKGRAIGWEPRGSRILYMGGRGKERQVHSIELDGTRDRTLPLTWASAPGSMDPRRMWDPEGRRMAFFVGLGGYPLTQSETIRGIAIIDTSGAVCLDTRKPEPEIQFQPQLSWTSDGGSLVYGYGATDNLKAAGEWRGGIAVMSADGADTRTVIEDSMTVLWQRITMEEYTDSMTYGR